VAITVIQKPQTLTLVGVIPDIIVETTGLGMVLKLSVGATDLLSEYYSSDHSGRARVNLRDFIDEQLAVDIPGDVDVYVQTRSWKTFTVEITVGEENTSFSFTALKGGSSKLNLDCPSFLKEAWLTWQVQTKFVRDTDPEWLSYFAQVDSDVHLKAYFAGGTSNELQNWIELDAGKHYTINTTFSHLRDQFTDQPIYLDIWITHRLGASSKFSTWHMRYVLSTEIPDYDDLFLFHNGLGGIDTIRFTGEKRSVNPIEVDSALFYDEYEVDYQVTPRLAFEKNTGYFKSREAMLWAQDFFLNKQRYIYEDETLVPIRLISPDPQTQDWVLVSYEFTYGYTRQTPYLALFKKKNPLIDPVIIGPGDDDYYLPPKISDFPQLTDPANALFPVQIPGSPGWFFVTWTTMLSHIYAGLPLVQHNATIGKQGGAPGEYYHLSAEEYEKVQNMEGGINQDTKFLSGGFWVYSGSDLIFDTVVTECQFPGSNEVIVIPSTRIDLADFPELDNGTYPQFARPKWNRDGVVVPIFGEAAEDTQVPAVEDPVNEIAGDPLLLSAGATSVPPVQIATGTIFAEGAAGEATLGQSGSGTSNFASTNNPINGSISGEVTNVQANFTTNATPPAPVFLADYTAVAIKIRLKAPMDAGLNLGIFCRKDGAIVTKTKMLPIDKNSTAIQVLGIPIAQFEASTPTVDQIVLRWYRNSGATTHPGYFFDDWILQGGIQPPPPNTDGVRSVTGDGVGGTAKDVVLTFPTPTQIGAYTKTEADAKFETIENVEQLASDLTDLENQVQDIEEEVEDHEERITELENAGPGGGGGLELIPFSTIIDMDGNYKAQTTQTGAIAYTKGSFPSPTTNFENETVHYIEANGTGGKPTFSSDFVMCYDSWANSTGSTNQIRFKGDISGYILVYMTSNKIA
jgi:hypothetical protein